MALIESVFDACKRGYLNDMIIHLEGPKKPDINGEDSNGDTPLILAIRSHSLPLVKELLRRGANEKKETQSGLTALIEATLHEDVDIMTAIRKQSNHLDINHENKNGDTALVRACRKGNATGVKFLIKETARINREGKNGSFAALEVTWKGHNHLMPILHKAKADWKKENRQHLTPLLMAAKYGHKKIVEYLIDYGVGITTPNSLGRRAIEEACNAHQMAVVELLLNRGERLSGENDNGETLLMAACRTGDLAQLNRLVVLYKKFLDEESSTGLTPLVNACCHGQLEAVKLLVESGANPNLETKKGELPLCAAIRHNQVSVFDYLIEDPLRCKIWKQNKRGESPIIVACEAGRREMMNALITAGVSVEEETAAGHTPLITAVANDHADLVIDLLVADANYAKKNRLGKSATSVAKSKGFWDYVRMFNDCNSWPERKTFVEEDDNDLDEVDETLRSSKTKTTAYDNLGRRQSVSFMHEDATIHDRTEATIDVDESDPTLMSMESMSMSTSRKW